jgi:hypothetical protein
VVKSVKEREILQGLNPLASILFLLVAEVPACLLACLFDCFVVQSSGRFAWKLPSYQGPVG